MSAGATVRQLEIWVEPTARKHASDIERLVPLARELARERRWRGVTVAHVRQRSIERGLLTGRETGRELSFLGAVMRAAKLTPTDRFERSEIEQSHGNLHRVFVDPEACV